MGVGNLPAVTVRSETSTCDEGILERRTLGETRTEETGDLFDQSFGSQEGVVLFRELLDELFVLVEPEYIIIIMKFVAKDYWLGEHPLFQIINRHVLELNLLGTIDIGSISKNADGHARTRNVREPVKNVTIVLVDGGDRPLVRLT